MTAFSSLVRTVATITLHSSRLMFTALAASAFSLAFVGTVSAQTGDPQTNTFGWVPNSTNEYECAQLCQAGSRP